MSDRVSTSGTCANAPGRAIHGVGMVAAMLLTGCFGSNAQGSLAWKGTAVGAFDGSVVAKCGSGLAQGFMGVDLVSTDKKIEMRIIQNPDPSVGPTILLVPTWEKVEGKTAAFKLERQNCSKIDVDVHRTSMEINDIPVLEGTASFDCAPKSGGSIRGDLKFSMCH